MASQAALYSYSSVAVPEYGGRGVSRSAAGVVTRPAERPTERGVARPAERPSERVRSRTIAVPKSKYGISMFSILGTAFVFALALFLVLARVKFIEVTNETVNLEVRMKAAEAEERRLEIEYERAFDMTEVENYAMAVLGMTKPDAEQVTVIQTAASDRSAVLSVQKSTAGGLKGLGSFLSSLLEYLK